MEERNLKIKQLINTVKKMEQKKTYSPPGCPEVNGKAERINRTLRNSAKTLLYWAELSENFWKFCHKTGMLHI